MISFLFSGMSTDGSENKIRAHIVPHNGGEFTALIETFSYNGKQVIPGNSSLTYWEGSHKENLKLNEIDSIIILNSREIYKVIKVHDSNPDYEGSLFLGTLVYRGRLSLYEVYRAYYGTIQGTPTAPSLNTVSVKPKYYTKQFDDELCSPFRKKRLLKSFSASCSEFQKKYSDKKSAYIDAKEMIKYYSQNCN